MQFLCFLKCCKFKFSDSTISQNECKKNGFKKALSGWDDVIGIGQGLDEEHNGNFALTEPKHVRF